MTPPRRAARHAALARFVLLAAVLVCACGVPEAQSPRALVMRDVKFPLRDIRFPSGLRVIVEEDHRAPNVGVFVLVGAGSTSDPPGKEGLAHYVEHLTFRSRPDGKTSVWNLVERAGAGAWNASTSFDETLYWSVGPKEALPSLLTLEAVRLLAPIANVAPEVAAVEREVVRSELRSRNETGVFGSIFGYVQAAVFPAGHPYARAVIGTHESLSTATLEDAQAFVKQHYRPENVTMVVIGDVDLASVGRVIEESLPAELRAGAQGRAPAVRLDATAPEPPAPPPAGPMARYEAALPTPELWIGWSLPRGFDAEGYLDRFVTFAAAHALSYAFLHDSDILDIGVMLVPGKQASVLLCRAALRDGADPERAQERVLNQLVRMWDWDTKRGVQAVRTASGRTRLVEASRGNAYMARELGFERLHRTAVTAMVLGAESLRERGRERVELTHFSGDPAAYASRLKAVMGVDAAHLADFAYKYLTRERARAVLVTPFPGNAAPPDDGGDAALAVPLDEAPARFDAQAIRRFVHAPGVSAYRRATLENGLDVIVGRRPGLPVVTVGLSLHGGAATAAPPGADQLMRRLGRPKVTSRVVPADFGGHLLDAYDRDNLSYTFEGSAGNVGNMLDLLAERAPAMAVDPQSVAFFGRDVIPYLARTELLPEAQASRAFWKTLYGEHPYGRTVVARDLAALGAGDANQWVEAVAVPRNASLAIVGEIDPDEVLGLVRATFGRWSSSAGAQPPPPPPPLPASHAPRPTVLIAHRPGATQGRIRFGCLLPPAGASRARYDVMARLLGDRTTDLVRHAMGASSGFHGRASTYRGGAAHLSLAGDVDNAHLESALGVLKRALVLFEQGHFRDGEVDVARWRVARAYGVGHDTNRSLVEDLLAARNAELEPRVVDDYPEELVAITPQALAADFARCQAAPVISIVGDEPTIRAAVEKAWP